MEQMILGTVRQVSSVYGLSVDIDGLGNTGKYYKCNTDGTYATGDKVLLVRVSGTYIVLCKVGNPTE